MSRFRLPMLRPEQRAQLDNAHDRMVDQLARQIATGRRASGQFMRGHKNNTPEKETEAPVNDDQAPPNPDPSSSLPVELLGGLPDTPLEAAELLRAITARTEARAGREAMDRIRLTTFDAITGGDGQLHD